MLKKIETAIVSLLQTYIPIVCLIAWSVELYYYADAIIDNTTEISMPAMAIHTSLDRYKRTRLLSCRSMALFLRGSSLGSPGSFIRQFINWNPIPLTTTPTINNISDPINNLSDIVCNKEANPLHPKVNLAVNIFTIIPSPAFNTQKINVTKLANSAAYLTILGIFSD
jgi:hypothetical protein